MEESKSVRSIYVPEEELNKRNLVSDLIKEVEADLEKVMASCKDWVQIQNKKVYYVVSKNIIIADSKRYTHSASQYSKKLDNIDEMGRELNQNIAKSLFYRSKRRNPLMDGDFVIDSDGAKYGYIACASNRALRISDCGIVDCDYSYTSLIKIPYIPVKYKRTILTFIKYGLIPTNTTIPKKYTLLEKLYTNSNIRITDNEKIAYIVSEVNKAETYQEIQASYKDYSMCVNDLKESLLNVDKKRADIEPYDPTVLTDIGVGHWDLWEMSQEKDGFQKVNLTEPLVARNPLADVLDDGIIGIDFGTRSTVVGYQNGSENIHLLRIGKGNLRKKATSADYENPTIMEFDDIASFLNSYAEKDGRPQTSWEDIKVSHPANENFNNTKSKEDSENFYSFFYNLKQWCGNVNYNKLMKIRSMRTGEELTLSKYVDLNDGDFDPIEIYAYYLGLYINNMRNKIYLRYIMSFPVTYEKRVREKILDSFRKGLRKSLPDPVLQDEATMSRFEVTEGAGEPASYAVCALESFHCAPDDDSSILYGVFDFGGGTTDFDYGIWRYADKDSIDEERYDYVVEHFGAAGSQYLGGENLLELLAFETFKANKELLLKEHIKFTKPVYMDAFDEMEDLVDDTQIANRNTKQLAEALRNFWESSISLKEIPEEPAASLMTPEEMEEHVFACQKHGNITDYSKLVEFVINVLRVSLTNADIKAIAGKLGITVPKTVEKQDRFPVAEIVSDFQPLKEGTIAVDLFSADGSFKSMNLFIKKDGQVLVDLLGILKSKIEAGIKNFCQAFAQATATPAFKEKNLKISSIYIFLAGNSSRSKIVTNLFNQYIHEYFPDICKQFGIDLNQNLFLMPPLGSKEADAILKQYGETVDMQSLTRPTGKTGVVYGLIESRKGGTILVRNATAANDEIPFKYFVGIKKRNAFKNKVSKNTGYGEWVRLVNAQIREFEIYYSSLPEALTGSLPITDTSIKKKNLRIAEASDDQNVSIYIRATKPSTMEYCVASAEGIQKGEYLQEPVAVNLI